MFDVAVVGAGVAGIVCAQQLVQAGYRVVVVEKSRGLGGRVATRRLHGTCADHGVSDLQPKGQLQQLVQSLSDRHILQLWTDTVYKWSPQQLQPTTQAPRYIAPTGMNAIAKFLATGLEVWLNQRVQAIAPTASNSWSLTLEPTPNSLGTSDALQQPELTVRAVVIAIPAPQALILLEPLAGSGLPVEFLDNLRSVEFDPCLSVIAGYPAQSQPEPTWKAVTFDNSDLTWVVWDSSKRRDAQIDTPMAHPPVFVMRSSAEFARCHLEDRDLNPAGYQLLDRAAEYLLPWLGRPDWMQVHRWRYAFPIRPWHETHLSTGTLVCCGDWCGGNEVESAISSGLAAATQISQSLPQCFIRAEPDLNF